MEIKKHNWDESLAWKNKKELTKPIARETCPRCRSKTVLGDYLYCPSCGWEDYEIVRTYPVKKRDDALKGNVHFIQYGGDITTFKEITLKVVIRKGYKDKANSANPLIEPECPFCNKTMYCKNVSWRKALIVHNKHGKKYTLFACVDGHRLELHLGEEEFTWI